MGLLDGIGQLLDPAGILSNNGGQQQGGLGTLLNPGGALLSLITGEAKKTESNPQQTMKTASLIRNFFDHNQVEQAGPDQSKPADAADPGATTELPKDASKNVDGYANPDEAAKLHDDGTP